MSYHSVHQIDLHPGDFYFGDKPVQVSTLLGSCVSVTMWHPTLRHGGMCHYMLDSRAGETESLDGRYADDAMSLFMQELKRRGTHPAEYEVKAFGGGMMFPAHVREDKPCSHVGCRNVHALYRLLHRHGFRLKAQHVGGYGHRRVVFDLHNGQVWLKYQPPGQEEGRLH